MDARRVLRQPGTSCLLPMWLAAALSLHATACSDGSGAGSPPPVPDGGAGGAHEEIPCPAGEWLADDGSCMAAGENAGVAPEACAEGFTPSDSGGCLAVLPPEPCGGGLMAVPGESSCRAIADCGSAPWGAIPVEADTEYVDAAYAGTASDGSDTAPWTTIGEALDAASEGAIIAVAAGTYAEDVRIEGKAVRLWGRCPERVRLEGAGMQPAALTVFDTDGVEIRALSLTGPRMGVWVRDSADTLLERIWVEQTESYAVVVHGATAAATVTGSLLEAARGGGVVVHGGVAELADSEVRDTRATPQGILGFGVAVDPDQDTGDRGDLTVRRCWVARSTSAGAVAYGSHLHLEESVIQDTRPQPTDPIGGQGLQVRYWAADDHPGSATVISSVIEGSHENGIAVVGGDLQMESSTVRGVEPRASDGDGGFGLLFAEDVDELVATTAEVQRSLVAQSHGGGVVVRGATATLAQVRIQDVDFDAQRVGRGLEAAASNLGAAPTRLTLRSSAIEDCHELGVMLSGVEATVEGTYVGSVAPAPGGHGGYGLAVQLAPETLERTKATIRGSVVEDAFGVGVLVSGSEATIEGTAVRRIETEADGGNGLGMCVQYAPEPAVGAAAAIRSSAVADCRETGIMIIGADVELAGVRVAGIAPDDHGGFGDGIAVASHFGWPARAEVLDCHVSDSGRAGIASFGAQIVLGATRIDCNSIDLDGEENGGAAFVFEDVGGNACGCSDESRLCRVLSSNLEPPSPIE